MESLHNGPLRPPLAGQEKAKETLAACQALISTRCVCGRAKKVRNAFCLDCYLGMPAAMQKALWKRVGQGFEEAYAAAKEWLLA